MLPAMDASARPASADCSSLRAEIERLRTELVTARAEAADWRSVIEGANDAIFLADTTSGLVIDANQRAAELIGRPRSEVIGMHQAQLHPPEEQDDKRAEFRRHVADGQGIIRQVHVLHASGRRIPVEISGRVFTVGGRTLIQGNLRDVSERHRLEVEVVERDHLLRSIIDALPVGVAFYDAELRHRLLNPVAQSYRPHTFAQLEGLPAIEGLRPAVGSESAEAIVARYREVLAGGQPWFASAMPLVHFADGSTHWWDFSVRRIDGRDGRVLGLLVNAIDVSEHVLARRAIEESEARYRAIGESFAVGARYTGPDGRTRFISQAMLEVIGVPDMAAFTTERFFARMPAGDAEALAAAWNHCLATGEALDHEFRIRDGEGRLRTILARGRQAYDRDGAVVGWAGINLDISERKVLERRLRAALAAAHMGTWHWDASSDTIYWDDSLRAVVGLADDVVLPCGSGFSEWIHPDDRDRVGAAVSAAMAGSGHYEAEFRLRHADGAWHWHQSRGVVASEGGVPMSMTGACIDVTDRHLAEDEIRRQAEELSRSNAELEQFSYIAAHDLQEPLRNITSYLSLIERRLSEHLDARGREWVNYVMVAAGRMRGLIQAVLSYSLVGRQAIEATDLALGDPLNDALGALDGKMVETGASIEIGEFPRLTGDRVLLGLVFQNLLGNALKFRSEAAPRIAITVRDAGAAWEVLIRDNGIGIDPEDEEKLFKIFQRLHAADRYPGTGIGLASCKRIIERHGGRIWIERPAEGAGTCFAFSLPKR